MSHRQHHESVRYHKNQIILPIYFREGKNLYNDGTFHESITVKNIFLKKKWVKYKKNYLRKNWYFFFPNPLVNLRINNFMFWILSLNVYSVECKVYRVLKPITQWESRFPKKCSTIFHYETRDDGKTLASPWII